ncbi:MAG: hypothetical protein AABZ31_04945 [Bdellovibrionota bacterium]
MTALKQKILLSIFLAFHVSAIFVLPNPDSILYREWQNVFATYGSSIGMNTTWRFFSPNPALSTVEYEVVRSGEEPERHRYPESVAQVGSREAFNRLMNFAIFMAANREYLEKYLHPYICKLHPEAEQISYYVITNKFPTIENAQLRASSREDLSVKARNGAGEFDCKKVAESTEAPREANNDEAGDE